MQLDTIFKKISKNIIDAIVGQNNNNYIYCVYDL